MIRYGLMLAMLFMAASCQSVAATDDRKMVPYQLERWSAGTGELAKLARIDSSLITLTETHSDDAGSCQANLGREMRRALYSCRPLLEIFRAFEAVRFDISNTGYLADPENRISRKFDSDGARFFALAKDRKYPAVDVPLVMYHTDRASVFRARKQYAKAIAELDAVLEIFATSKIENAEFDDSDALRSFQRSLQDKVDTE